MKKICISSSPYGPFKQLTNTTINNQLNFHAIYTNAPYLLSKKLIYMNLLIHQNRKHLNTTKNIFLSLDGEFTIELARLLCSVLSGSISSYMVEITKYVTNYHGGDIIGVQKMIMEVNSKDSCSIIIVKQISEHREWISPLNSSYKKITKRCIVICESNSSLLGSNSSLIFNQTLENHVLVKFCNQFPEILDIYRPGIIGNLSNIHFSNWTTMENYLNFNLLESGKCPIVKVNEVGPKYTLEEINKTLIRCRYKITFDYINKGLINCGVEGSGKTYLGDLLSNIKGVVTIKTFSRDLIDSIKLSNRFIKELDWSIYLIFLDECEQIFFDSTRCGEFKELTGSNDFPRNVLIFATSNKDISLFDKSLYRTGRLQYQFWDYLTESDITSHLEPDSEYLKRWLNLIEIKTLKIRYVDFMKYTSNFQDVVFYRIEKLWMKGVEITIIETDESNRTNLSEFTILKTYGLFKIRTIREVEDLIIYSTLSSVLVSNLAWCISSTLLSDSNMNIFELPFILCSI